MTGKTLTTKKRTADDIMSRLHVVEELVIHGVPIVESVQTAHITEITYYRWRRSYGGLSRYQVGKVIELQDANGRLRRKVRELELDKLILIEVSRELLVTPEQRRAWIDHATITLGVSERRACQVLGQNRSTQRKKPKLLRTHQPVARLSVNDRGAPLLGR
jgi:hypothetical protein